jgi:hypothetical protein
MWHTEEQNRDVRTGSPRNARFSNRLLVYYGISMEEAKKRRFAISRMAMIALSWFQDPVLVAMPLHWIWMVLPPSNFECRDQGVSDFMLGEIELLHMSRSLVEASIRHGVSNIQEILIYRVARIWTEVPQVQFVAKSHGDGSHETWPTRSRCPCFPLICLTLLRSM